MTPRGADAVLTIHANHSSTAIQLANDLTGAHYASDAWLETVRRMLEPNSASDAD